VISTSFTTTNPRVFKKILGIAGALVTLAFPFILMLHNENNHIEAEQSLCPFKMLTGFPCPGCGITKSLIYLFEGNLYKSLYYHLFGPPAFLFCMGIILLLSTELITGKEYLQRLFYNQKLAYALGFTLAGYHFIRLILFICTNNVDDILRQSIWM
jgi:hypothetical protein